MFFIPIFFSSISTFCHPDHWSKRQRPCASPLNDPSSPVDFKTRKDSFSPYNDEKVFSAFRVDCLPHTRRDRAIPNLLSKLSGQRSRPHLGPVMFKISKSTPPMRKVAGGLSVADTEKLGEVQMAVPEGAKERRTDWNWRNYQRQQWTEQKEQCKIRQNPLTCFLN